MDLMCQRNEDTALEGARSWLLPKKRLRAEDRHEGEPKLHQPTGHYWIYQRCRESAFIPPKPLALREFLRVQ